MDKLYTIRKIVNGDAFVSILDEGYIKIHINITSRIWNDKDNISDIEIALHNNLELIQKLKNISLGLYTKFKTNNDTFNINIKNNTLSISFSLDDIHFV
jgi:hypothetical protein